MMQGRPLRVGLLAYGLNQLRCFRGAASLRRGEREACAKVALDLYDLRKRNGAREWDEWAYAAAQVAAAIRNRSNEGARHNG